MGVDGKDNGGLFGGLHRSRLQAQLVGRRMPSMGSSTPRAVAVVAGAGVLGSKMTESKKSDPDALASHLDRWLVPNKPNKSGGAENSPSVQVVSRFDGSGTDFEGAPSDMRRGDDSHVQPEKSPVALPPSRRRDMILALALPASAPASVPGFGAAATFHAVHQKGGSFRDAQSVMSRNASTIFGLKAQRKLAGRLAACNGRNIPFWTRLDERPGMNPITLAALATIGEMTAAPLEVREVAQYRKGAGVPPLSRKELLRATGRLAVVSIFKNAGPNYAMAKTVLSHQDKSEQEAVVTGNDGFSGPDLLRAWGDGFRATFPGAFFTQGTVYDAASAQPFSEMGTNFIKRVTKPKDARAALAIAACKSAAVGGINVTLEGLLQAERVLSSQSKVAEPLPQVTACEEKSVKKPLDQTEGVVSSKSTVAEPLSQVNECQAESVKPRVRTGPYG